MRQLNADICALVENEKIQDAINVLTTFEDFAIESHDLPTARIYFAAEQKLRERLLKPVEIPIEVSPEDLRKVMKAYQEGDRKLYGECGDE